MHDTGLEGSGGSAPPPVPDAAPRDRLPGTLMQVVNKEFTKKLDTTDLESRLGLTGHPPSNHDGRQGGNDAPRQSFKNAA